jgi:formylglycine-generating enzyme required for sulfatase activity
MRYLAATIIIWTRSLFAFGQSGEFEAKQIEETLVKITDVLYASQFEVSNKHYSTFLKDLKQNKQIDKQKAAQIDTANWNTGFSKENPYAQYYHSHPAYDNFPVVNVSYEGAALYCAWLTDNYNTSKEKQFKKVRFRLPSAEEWTVAAQGGNTQAIYPWQGNDFLTKKGQYQCNFKRDEKAISEENIKRNENADITAPVKAYWANGFGLYNMSGNVAEMISAQGKTKGGSWFDDQEAMKIESTGQFKDGVLTSTSIGFRYFMDVIEK